MKRVCLITQFYDPEPEYLFKNLSQFLNEDYTVNVVTGFPNYPKGKIYDGYKQKINFSETINGINVIRLPIYANHSKSKLKRGFSYLSFMFSLLFFGLFRIPKSDLYVVYSPPPSVAFATFIISKIRRKNFILNIQDMWPDTLTVVGLNKDSIISKFISFFLKVIYKNATKIVVLSEGFKSNLIEKGVSPSKISVISNWSQNYSLDSSNSCVEFEKVNIYKDDFILTFAGNIGFAQKLDTAILAMKDVVKINSKIRLLLVGDGTAVDSLKKLVDEYNLHENVLFTGRIDSLKMGIVYERTNSLLIHLKKDPLFEITIPHKLLSYLYVGKPIVSAVDGEVNKIVLDSGAGLVSESENHTSMAENILKIASFTNEKNEIIKANMIEFYNKNYSKTKLLDKWKKLIKDILDD